jgi:hypothetical protein
MTAYKNNTADTQVSAVILLSGHLHQKYSKAPHSYPWQIQMPLL